VLEQIPVSARCGGDRDVCRSERFRIDPGLGRCRRFRYIVDGLKKERIKPILDLCISRFNAFSKLQDELERTKSALEDRKVIDRAKAS